MELHTQPPRAATDIAPKPQAGLLARLQAEQEDRDSYSMLRNAQFWILSILAALSLALVIANMEFTRMNSALQSEVGARNRILQQGVQLESLYGDVGRALGDLAVKNKDEKLRAMLAKNGIKITETGEPPASGAHP